MINLEEIVERLRDQIREFFVATLFKEQYQKYKTETYNFYSEIKNISSWAELKERIENLDPLLVAEFWRWDLRVLPNLRKMIIAHLQERTTSAKRRVLEVELPRLNPALKIYFNSLNFYIGK